MRQLEQHGQNAASTQLNRNGELIITLALVSAAGLIALAPTLVNEVVGQAFRTDATTVTLGSPQPPPWLVSRLTIDIAFQLARQSRWQVCTSIVAALTNVVLNLLLIPRFGILATWSTLTAYTLAALVSGWLGKRMLPCLHSHHYWYVAW